MAIAANTVWEVRSGGNANNSGGFNPANANMLTDATATSATGNSPVISSASYNFVAGDVGAWVYIKAGTNWTPGWYKIASVASNAATVNATIGQAIQVVNGVYGTNTVAGCATTTSPTGGTFTCDYSQQTSAKLSITDAASIGASTTMTSATAGFTPVMVGNLFHLTTTGTGAHGIIGWYEIVSYTNATTVVTDVTTNDGTALVAGTGAVGGAIATLGAIGAATARLGAVAGNVIWLNGAFTRTTGTDTLSFSGSTTSPIKVIGYGTTRGDAYLGRTNGNGDLITTNLPTYTYTTGSLTYSGSWIVIESIKFAAASNTNAILVNAADNFIFRCPISNASTGTSGCCIQINAARGTTIDCDMTVTNGGGIGLAALNNTFSGGYRNIGCRIKSTSIGIRSNSSNGTIANCTIYSCGGFGIGLVGTGDYGLILNNTIVSGSSDGINIVTGNTLESVIMNNMITDNTGDGIDMVSTANAAFIAYNRYRDNASAIANGGDWITATNYGAVTTDTGGAETDYVNAAGNDYNLISGSPAASAAIPKYASMGALQRPQTAGASSYTFGG